MRAVVQEGQAAPHGCGVAIIDDVTTVYLALRWVGGAQGGAAARGHVGAAPALTLGPPCLLCLLCLLRSGVLDAAKELEKLGKREAEAVGKVRPLRLWRALGDDWLQQLRCGRLVRRACPERAPGLHPCTSAGGAAAEEGGAVQLPGKDA